MEKLGGIGFLTHKVDVGDISYGIKKPITPIFYKKW